MGSSKRIPIPDWRQMEGTPEKKIKGRFDELSKKELKESIPDWMDELKELGKSLELSCSSKPTCKSSPRE
jgi:16S rRNA (cytosine967-C5)-methyltransferase